MTLRENKFDYSVKFKFVSEINSKSNADRERSTNESLQTTDKKEANLKHTRETMKQPKTKKFFDRNFLEKDSGLMNETKELRRAITFG